MVDSLAPGVARGWRGFRHGGGYRGGKRGPSTLQRRAPREVGREKSGPREKRAEGSRSDEVAGKSGPAADPGPPKSKFTIVCSLWLRYSFSVYPFFGPFLVFLSSSLTLCFVHSLPDRAFPLSFLSPLLSNFFFLFVSRFLFRALARLRIEPAQAVTSDEHPTRTTGKSREVRHARFG